MRTPLVLWTILASLATLLPTHSFAQLKAPVKPAIATGASVQILPVSFTDQHVAATVNNEKILVGEVRKILDARPIAIALTEEQKRELRKAAVDLLVDDALMRQYLAKQVAQVGRAEFEKEFKDLEEALKKQNKSMQEFLAESGQTLEQLQRDVVARLQWRSMLVRLLPEDKAKDYYTENKLFFDKVYVRASHILIKLPQNYTKEQHATALQQMLVWRQEILTGKSKFEDIARLYSQCPSKEKAGDIGQFPSKGIVLPEIGKAAFAMKVGDVSDVIQTVSGLHLVKVTDRIAGEPSTYEGVRQAVREVWAQDQDLYERILDEQRKVATIKIELP